MPSKKSQAVRIISARSKKTGKTYYIMIAKRTGFLDVWIGNKHYYYNYNQKNINPNNLDIDKIVEDVQAREEKKRGVIIIRRK